MCARAIAQAGAVGLEIDLTIVKRRAALFCYKLRRNRRFGADDAIKNGKAQIDPA